MKPVADGGCSMRRTVLWVLGWVVCGVWCGGWPATVLAQPPRVPAELQLTRDVEYGRGGERPLRMHLLVARERASEALPVLVWIHGGGWSGGSRDSGLPRLIPFARQGFFCVSIEYRFSQEAIFPAQIEDCKCAIRFLRAHADKYGLDPDRIGVWGNSAGGHLVALLGTSAEVKELEGTGGWAEHSSAVQAVCDFCGPADFPAWSVDTHRAVRQLFGGPLSERLELARLASPVTHASPKAPPFLIVHGDQDDVVPIAQSESLYQALKAHDVDVTFERIQGAGHALASPEVMQLAAKFFERTLKPTSETDASP